MDRGVPVILRAEWQENSAKPCDTGSSIKEMEREWERFDWGSVDPVYPAKTGLYEYSKRGLTDRGIAARKVSYVYFSEGMLNALCMISLYLWVNADFGAYSG